MVAEVMAGRRLATSAKLTKIVNNALEVIDDRLENGDHIYNQKTGEIVRKPVTLRDATTAANALMQREAILEKMSKDEEFGETQATIAETLQELARQFAKMNKQSTAGAEDIEYVEESDAVHDEREEGLQEGSGEIHVEAGSSEEENRTEQSTGPYGKGWQGAQGGWESGGPHPTVIKGWEPN